MPKQQDWMTDAEGNIVVVDKAAIGKPIQRFPQGISGFDNPLKPLNTPNATNKDIIRGIKQFSFAPKSEADIVDTGTVLAKNKGIQYRTNSGKAEDKFNMQYNPDDPNSFGYQTRFLFMKDPVNHYTEAPAVVTETDGMVYEKQYLAAHDINAPAFTINPKKSIPTKDTGSLTVEQAQENLTDGPFGPDGSANTQNTLSTYRTETPKDKNSLGDEATQSLKNWSQEMQRQIDIKKNK